MVIPQGLTIPISVFTREEIELDRQGLLPDNYQSTGITNMTFYSISAVSTSVFYPERAVIYVGSTYFEAMYSEVKVKELIQKAIKQTHLHGHN